MRSPDGGPPTPPRSLLYGREEIVNHGESGRLGPLISRHETARFAVAPSWPASPSPRILDPKKACWRRCQACSTARRVDRGPGTERRAPVCRRLHDRHESRPALLPTRRSSGAPARTGDPPPRPDLPRAVTASSPAGGQSGDDAQPALDLGKPLSKPISLVSVSVAICALRGL